MKFGVAPINWTNDDMPELGGGDISYEQCMDEMALAGYEGCEIGTKFPTESSELNEALSLRNLKVCNQFETTYSF